MPIYRMREGEPALPDGVKRALDNGNFRVARNGSDLAIDPGSERGQHLYGCPEGPKMNYRHAVALLGKVADYGFVTVVDGIFTVNGGFSNSAEERRLTESLLSELLEVPGST